MLNDSAMHVALMVVSISVSVSSGLGLSPTRFGCCAMMATRRREFLAVVARVGLRLAAAADRVGDSFLRGCEADLTWSAELLERKGFEVKKCRFRGKLAGVVRWKERRGLRDVTALWMCRATTLSVIRCGGYLMVTWALPCVIDGQLEV